MQTFRNKPFTCTGLKGRFWIGAALLSAATVSLLTTSNVARAESPPPAPAAPPPKDTAPKDTAPKDTAPKDTAPKDTAPKDTAPKDTAPKDTAPKDTAPKDTAPKDTAPKDTAPKDTAPKDTAPKDTAPKDTAPKDTAPKDTAPKDTAPKDTAPKDTAPKDTAPKDGTQPEPPPKPDAPAPDAGAPPPDAAPPPTPPTTPAESVPPSATASPATPPSPPGETAHTPDAPPAPAAPGTDVPPASGVEPGVPVAPPETPDAAASPSAATTGWIEGLIVSAEGGKPVPGAQVFISGQSGEVATDEHGRFRVEVPPGAYTVSVLHSKYTTQSTGEFAIEAGATEALEVKLEAATVEFEDYVVTAPFERSSDAALQAERRETTAVVDVIGRDQMTKSGATDAAGALARVTGITIVGGKFVYVRGMGERYSSTLVNGSSVPSPEPERRVVPLDLFPASVLESVVVQKTYSPERPGEFGGGVVEMRTQRFPERFSSTATGWLGGNSITTFQNGLSSRGGSLDFLGADDGTRALPGSIESRRIDEQNRINPDGFTVDQLEDIGEQFPRNYNLYRSLVPPDHSFNMSIGDSLALGPVPIGYVASVFYGRGFSRSLKTIRNLALGTEGLVPTVELTSENLVDTVKGGGILNLGSRYAPGHEIGLTTLLLRVTDNEALFAFGSDQNLDTDVRWTRLRFIERQLLTQQVLGTQRFSSLNGFGIDWRYSVSRADRDEPDRRELRYDDEALPGQPQAFQFSRRSDGNQRVYSVLDDNLHDLRVDLIQPFELVDEIESRVKIGGAITLRDRNVDTRRFSFLASATGAGGLAGPGTRGLQPDSVFAPENLGRDGFRFEETTLVTDAYRADQKIFAGYAMTELVPWTAWSFMAGLRVEKASQDVETFNRFTDEVGEAASLDDTDVLPAGTVTWKFWQDMQLRLGGSRTVSRPDFRELSVARFFDVESTRETFGNPALRRAAVVNMDARWEWYFGSDESVSVGGFGKVFDSPIETVGLAGSGTPQSWVNAESAVNVGLEIEGRKRLGFIDPQWDPFFVASNLSFIDSKVTVGNPVHPVADVVVTSRERALQGQSPFVLNLQFGFDNVDEDSGLNATLLYNVFGRRISEVGSQGKPDIYEEPVHRLDFIVGWRINRHWRWNLRAQNLLNLAVRRTQGGIDVEAAEQGIDFSTGATWTY